MTLTERFFHVVEGPAAPRPPVATDRAPFFPDITTWYVLTRIPLGEEQPFWPGQYIPDDSPFHERPSRLDGDAGRLTFVDWYRQNGWGLPCHMYDWYDEELVGGVEKVVRTEGRERCVTFHVPGGELTRTYRLDAEGTWSEHGHMAPTLEQLPLVARIVEATRFRPRPERVEKFLRETDGFGVCDLVIFRSPFGKLVHEYMGFENVAYALHDDEAAVLDFLTFQEKKDLELVRLAAAAPGPIVIISDHADENLISPAWYRRYCMPYYRKACDILHGAGKRVSTHLDGNFKGYFPFIADTGFDLLDGCTPAPMFNYEPEELAAATVGRIACYCGVPASLFITEEPGRLAGFAERIERAFRGNVIVNVGDILPPNGSIEGVMRIGQVLSRC
ncbi:MAG TPA: uroporphyrinogen decarboxylase family protein [Spirochaetia bacterium]